MSRTYYFRRNRARLLQDNPPCALCGGPGADTADHIIPRAAGGSDALSNLQPAHYSCNSRRGKKPMHQVNFKPDTSGEW